MFGATTKIEPQWQRVDRAVGDAKFQTIRRASFAISRTAKASIIKSDEPSDPGSPPTTRGQGGHNLRGAIYVDATRDDGIIGPRASFVGDAGNAHEFGNKRKGDSFDERPFMGPALEANTDRFAADWRGEVGQ